MKILRALGGRLPILCGVGAVFTYVGWLWGSYDATHHLALLAEPAVGSVPVRHDTLAAGCGVGSALLLLACIYLWPTTLPRIVRLIRAGAWTGIVYGWSGWQYIDQNSVYHPQTLSRPLTHFMAFPQERTFGLICVVVVAMSILALLLLHIVANPARPGISGADVKNADPPN